MGSGEASIGNVIVDKSGPPVSIFHLAGGSANFLGDSAHHEPGTQESGEDGPDQPFSADTAMAVPAIEPREQERRGPDRRVKHNPSADEFFGSLALDAEMIHDSMWLSDRRKAPRRETDPQLENPLELLR